MCFGNVPDTLSQLIRTSFVAGEGKTFIVLTSPLSRARVIAWLATEKWRLDVFKTHGKIYEASAAQMFKVPIETVTKGSPLRQKGKVAELALGYQGRCKCPHSHGCSQHGYRREGAERTCQHVERCEQGYRASVGCGRRCRSWRRVYRRNTCQHHARHPLFVDNDILFIELPSGRRLSYIEPRVVAGQFGPALTYKGMDQTTKQWRTQYTYGGKLVENIVQYHSP